MGSSASIRAIRIRLARINAYLNENISGMSIVQLFTRERRAFEQFDDLNRDYLRANLNGVRAIEETYFTWLSSGALEIPLSFRLDPLSALMILVVTGIALGVGWVISGIPANMAKKRLEKRLKEVGSLTITPQGETSSVVRQDEQGPLRGVQKLIGKTGAGAGLSKLRDQSGVDATTGGILVVSAGPAVFRLSAVLLLAPVPSAAPLGLLLGALPPTLIAAAIFRLL